MTCERRREKMGQKRVSIPAMPVVSAQTMKDRAVA
jgi:hypothetical protein